MRTALACIALYALAQAWVALEAALAALTAIGR